MKYLVLVIFLLIPLLGKEKDTVIYKSDSVIYHCVEEKVYAEVYFNDGVIRTIPVVWINPYEENNTTILKCINFEDWLKDDDIKK